MLDALWQAGNRLLTPAQLAQMVGAHVHHTSLGVLRNTPHLATKAYRLPQHGIDIGQGCLMRHQEVVQRPDIAPQSIAPDKLMPIEYDVWDVPRLKRQQGPLPVLLGLPGPEVRLHLDAFRRPGLGELGVEAFRCGVQIGSTVHRWIVWPNGPGL